MGDTARRVRRSVGAALFVASAFATQPAAAEEACVRAFETAQEERLKNDLLKSRELLLKCSDVCPSPFRDQCVSWRSEIEAYLSSIRVRLTDPAGKELTIDAAYVDARAVPTNGEIMLVPGDHLVRVEVGKRAVEQRVVTKAKERGALVDLVLRPEPVAAPRSGGDEPPQGSKVPSIVAFSVGGVAAITAGALAIYGHAQRSDLASSCKPTCDPDDVTPIRTAWWAAAGFGVAAAAGAIIGIVLWPSKSTAITASPQAIRLNVTF